MKNLTKSFLCAGLAGGIAVSASAQIILEDFEGDTPPWDASTGNPELSTDQSLSGDQSLFIATTGDRATWNDFGELDAFSLTFHYFADSEDLGTNPRNYGQVQVLDGEGQLQQLLAIGNYHASGHDTSTYQYRVLEGGTTGWFDFDHEDIEVRNDQWVQFNITRDTAGDITFAVDGVVGATITDADPGAISVLDLGGLAFASTEQPGYFDDLTLVPEPSTYAAIFGGLALIAAFVYRRRVGAKK